MIYVFNIKRPRNGAADEKFKIREVNNMSNEVVLKVLNPAGEAKVEKKVLASRVGSLDDKKVALVWNQKNSGDVLLGRAAELLKEKFKNIEVKWFPRACCTPPPPGYIDSVVNESDVALGSIAD